MILNLTEREIAIVLEALDVADQPEVADAVRLGTVNQTMDDFRSAAIEEDEI